MAMDTPAKIAILGAGPIGLEAGLYARFLGYDVEIFERGDVAENVKRWGHVKMFSPFELNRSSLALAALFAQDENYKPPADDALLTGQEWREQFLLPLSRTDLIADHIHTHTEVLSVGRTHWLKYQSPGDAARGYDAFQILYRTQDGVEHRTTAEIVIDCSGVFSSPNWIGPGGTPALGEIGLRDQIEYGVPDVLGAERESYAGKRTLVIGSGYSAATTAVALAKLQEESGSGEIVWAIRGDADNDAPLTRLDDDRLPLRDQLAEQANQLAQSSGPIRLLAGRIVQRLEQTADGLRVTFTESIMADDPDTLNPEDEQQEGETAAAPGEQVETFDRIIANVGYRGDASITEELQVHRCYATDGPIKLAAALLTQGSADCLDAAANGAETLVCPEPNLYLLGAKSYARSSQFLFSHGLDQVRDLFSLIGERSTLDLYAGAKDLPT